LSHTQWMTLNHRTHAQTHSQSIVVANLPRVSLFHTYCTMLLDSCLNGTILDATFHNNMIFVVAILTTLRMCQICCHIRITILHHYKHLHILSCILLCSLGIATNHYRSSFNWYIVVVVTIMHKITPRVMLWLTCTNILWEYVVTNIVVVLDVVCIVDVVVMSLHSRPTSAIWHSRHEGITNRCSGPI